MKRPVFLLGAAAVFVVLRIGWSLADPLHFDVVKSQIYIRDFICLTPAALCGLAGLHAIKPKSSEIALRSGVVMSALLAFVVCGLVANFVLLGIPAVADEAAYLWQGQVFASGTLWSSVPEPAAATLIQYVGDLGAHRLGVFFPGSSLPLALGVKLGIETWINPFLSAVLAVMSAWAAKRIFGSNHVAVFTALLFATSPFLVFQGASYFSQIWTALFTLSAFVLGTTGRRKLEFALVGLLAGAAMFSRPLSAVIVGVVVVAFWFLTNRKAMLQRTGLALLGAAVPLVTFAWMNWSLTGSALTTVHTALLPEDKPVLGFNIVANIVLNAVGMSVDATGLVGATAALVLFCVWRFRHDKFVIVCASYAGAQVLAYAFYYNHGVSYGPRFLLEVAPVVVMLASKALSEIFRTKQLWVVLLAVAITFAGTFPERASMFRDRAEYLDLSEVEKLVERPSVVLVGEGLYEFPDPFYEAFVTNGVEPSNQQVTYLRADAISGCEAARSFPGRAIYDYEPSDRASGPKLEKVPTEMLCPRT